MFNIFKKQKETATYSVVSFIYEYARKSKKGKTHMYVYRNAAKKLAIFEESRGIKILSDSFTQEIAEDYIYFLQELNYQVETVRKLYTYVTHCLRIMHRRGYAINFSFEEIKLPARELTTQVYMSTAELQRIYELKFKDKGIEVLRDLFIVGCFTGLRFSDYSRLTVDNITPAGLIKIKTQKTGAVVELPTHRYIKEILAKYNGVICYDKTQQNFNKVVKNICKRAGINEKILCEYTRGHKVIRESKRKYELVGSHTARRSFATNAYLAGIPTARLMLLTGHNTEESFFRYIRISKKENAVMLADHPFFK